MDPLGTLASSQPPKNSHSSLEATRTVILLLVVVQPIRARGATAARRRTRRTWARPSQAMARREETAGGKAPISPFFCAGAGGGNE